MTLYDQTVHKVLNEKSVVVIGDVHGCLDLLNNELEQLAGFDAQLVFLGDYIDRGENGVGVLTLVRDMALHPQDWGFSNVTALLGNHEHMALMAAETNSPDDMRLWIHNGGRVEEFMAIKYDFKSWLYSLPTYYKHPKKVYFESEVKDLLCTHASVDPSCGLPQQNLDTLLWSRTVRGYDRNTILVNGHTPCERPQFYETTSGPVFHIDTGAYYTGELSCVIFEEAE